MKRALLCLAAAAAICAACQESLEDKCAREAEEYTRKKCPAPIGQNMTIDSLTFDRATHTLHYHYTLSGAADNAELLRNSDAGNMLLNEIKNATSVKDYKDAGYNFAYTYRSAKEPGKVLYEATFTRKDYAEGGDAE